MAAVLGDTLRRVSAQGGREGMPRSLGSVYGGSVTRFLGGGSRDMTSRFLATVVHSCGVAVRGDSSTLLLCDTSGGTDAVHHVRISDGARLAVIGGRGDEPLRFNTPGQVWEAPDGFVFVGDDHNRRVQVLTPELTFHGFIGVGQLYGAVGVCANTDVVVVSESTARRLSVFRRADGALVTRIGRRGVADGELRAPQGVCFANGGRHVAVAEYDNHRVSVFTVEGGDFVRHVGVGVLSGPVGVACSAFDELVVTDAGHRCLRLFSDTGDLLMTFGRAMFTGVAVYGCVVFAMDAVAGTVVVWRRAD